VQCEPTSTVTPLCAEPGPGGSGEPGSRATRELKLELDVFARQALEEEAARLGVSVEELASFAVLYYLADSDSGRIARRPLGPTIDEPHTPDDSHPLGKLLDS
jgi:hypothetical protein